MAKTTKRKAKPIRAAVTASDRERIAIDKGLRAAVRREREIPRLSRALNRLRARADGDLYDMAVRIVEARGFSVIHASELSKLRAD